MILLNGHHGLTRYSGKNSSTEFVNAFTRSNFEVDLKDGGVFFDVGGGYGLTGLELAVKSGIRSFCFNVQDNYARLLSLIGNPEGFDGELESETFKMSGSLKGLETVAGIRLDKLENIAAVLNLSDPYKFDKKINYAHFRMQVLSIAQAIHSVIEKGLFNYVVGYAEEQLPKVRVKARRLVDYFGAYAYSPAKIELLESDFAALEEGGVAFIKISEKNRFDTYVRYMENQDMHRVRLITYLVNRYPEIFSRFPSDRDMLVMKKSNGSVKLQLPLARPVVGYSRKSRWASWESFIIPSLTYDEIP